MAFRKIRETVDAIRGTAQGQATIERLPDAIQEFRSAGVVRAGGSGIILTGTVNSISIGPPLPNSANVLQVVETREETR